MGQTIGYRRVSSGSQNIGRQELEGCDVVFEDVGTGKTRKRPQLEEMMRHARAGDTIVVHAIDRLARSLQDLQQIVDELVDNGVIVRFIKEGLEFSQSKDNATGRLMLQVLGSIAEFERTLIKSRQKEGIERAKREGKYQGRKRTINHERIIEYWEEDKNRTLKSIARFAGCSVSTVYRVLSQHQEYVTYENKNMTPRERVDEAIGALKIRGKAM